MHKYRDVIIKNVSRETFSRIEQYRDLLKKWNNRFNLTNLSDNLFYREACESLFASEIMKVDDINLFDIGSGNGIPGVLLAIFGVKKLSLIERNKKKCVFLGEIKRVMGLEYNVLNTDASALSYNSSAVISKAVSSTAGILNICKKSIGTVDKIFLFKKKAQLQEIYEAKSEFYFQIEVLENKYIDDNVIFVLSNISLR